MTIHFDVDRLYSSGGLPNDDVELAFQGTVVGSREQEAAVFALAKLREQQFQLQAASMEAVQKSPLKHRSL